MTQGKNSFAKGDVVEHPVVGRVRVLSVNADGNLITRPWGRVAVNRAILPQDCKLVEKAK